jgi:hypothetical protein
MGNIGLHVVQKCQELPGYKLLVPDYGGGPPYNVEISLEEPREMGKALSGFIVSERRCA